jgi:hypothetical protein
MPHPLAGIIAIWAIWDAGVMHPVPRGWHLCDGTEGTPDLTDMFVVGAGATYAIGDTGGVLQASVPAHHHAANTPTGAGTHSHTTPAYDLPDYTAAATALAGAVGPAPASTHHHTQNASVTGSSGSSHVHGVAGETDDATAGPVENRPYFTAWAYIMKLARP